MLWMLRGRRHPRQITRHSTCHEHTLALRPAHNPRGAGTCTATELRTTSYYRAACISRSRDRT